MFFSINQIDNAFFEVIRLALVAGGYLPDVVIYNTESTFKTALQAITAANKPIIRVFGVGNYKARNDIKGNKIVIDRLGTEKGSYGSPNLKEYESSGLNVFVEKQYPKNTVNINYQISFLTSEQKVDNILTTLIMQSLDEKGTLKGLNDSATYTQNEFHYFKQAQSYQNNENELIERAFRFTVTDIYITEKTIVQEDITIMEDFTFLTDIQNEYK